MDGRDRVFRMKAIFYCDDTSSRIVIHGEAAILQHPCPDDPALQPGTAKWTAYFSATRPLSQTMALAWLKEFGATDREQRLLLIRVLTCVRKFLPAGN